jgi:hypothetical protein
MPDDWSHREPPEHPRHAPTELAKPVPWKPTPYSRTQHLRRLAPRIPEEPPPRRRDQQPRFTPRPRQPRYEQPPPVYRAEPQPPRGYNPPPARQQAASRPKRKRRVFLWVFLAVQAVFLIWIIGGLASHPAGPTAAQQAAQQCANGGWQELFKSQADCDTHYAVGLNDTTNVGKGIGVALIVVFWMVTDSFLGLGYLVYKLASRR